MQNYIHFHVWHCVDGRRHGGLEHDAQAGSFRRRGGVLEWAAHVFFCDRPLQQDVMDMNEDIENKTDLGAHLRATGGSSKSAFLRRLRTLSPRLGLGLSLI